MDITMKRTLTILAGVTLLTLGLANDTRAQQPPERLCDPALEDCRAYLINLINHEPVDGRIDVAFWFMTDSRYSNALINRFNQGLKIRILTDTRSGESKPSNGPILAALKASGIPMRIKVGTGILHWKVMLFDKQNVVSFSKANFTPDGYVPTTPGSDWTDEAVYITNDSAITNSFRTRYDDFWTNTSTFQNYASVTGPLTRAYPTSQIVSWMNFPPGQDFATRAVSRIDQENEEIDVMVFRATAPQIPDALIRARARGVTVKLITEPGQYRKVNKLEHAYNIDRLKLAGVEIKDRNHLGLMHEAAIVLRGLQEVIFGSSNWTPQSANQQIEHNFFYSPAVPDKPWFYTWFRDQFDGKWNNTANPSVNGFVDFVPLPPGSPQYVAPANGAAGTPYNVTLKWDGGNWAWKYDLYFGTTAQLGPADLIAPDLVVGSPKTGVIESYTVQNLQPGTRYYWRVVGKTMANQTNSGPSWNFTTAPQGGGTASDIVLYPGHATTKGGNWEIVSDPTAAGGVRMHEVNAGAAKVEPPSASPANYFSMSFNAEAGIPYRLWMRGKADNDGFANDSVWVQFTNTVDASGTPMWRLGSTTGTWVGVQACSGCPIQGWGWHDNSYGVNAQGLPVYFASSGVQTIRVQQREDGISIDQIVLSPATYASASPGAPTNDTVILPEQGGVPGDEPPAGINEIVMHANDVSTIFGAWSKQSVSSAADQTALVNPDQGAPKPAAKAAPGTYFEKTFTVDPNKAYHLWIRMNAANDAYQNDSVYVQFSGSKDGSGAARWRIGTTDAMSVSLEEGQSQGRHAWGWNDNSYGALGAPVYFSGTTQTIRIQQREDGVSIDQIVLSAVKYLTTRPGALKNDTTILPATVGPDSGGSPTASGTNEVVLYASDAQAPSGNWVRTSDSSAATGTRLWNPNQGRAKLRAALAQPTDYFELTFAADSDKPYHLWARMQAENNSVSNDSFFAQFSDSVTSSGSPVYRIATTSAAPVSLQDGNGKTVHGWGWNDNSYGGFAGPVYFANDGTHTMRIQRRDDGVSIDQIVLSAVTYLNRRPGSLKNDTTIVPKP
jgi:hypothetical protein